MKVFFGVWVLLLSTLSMSQAMYGIPNCTDPCPNATAMCWDTTMGLSLTLSLCPPLSTLHSLLSARDWSL